MSTMWIPKPAKYMGPKSGWGQSQAGAKVRSGPKSGWGQSQDWGQSEAGAKVSLGPKSC